MELAFRIEILISRLSRVPFYLEPVVLSVQTGESHGKSQPTLVVLASLQ